MPKYNRRKDAFSLVELLVIVAIIFILSAIMFPSLGAGKAQARNSMCMSNLHSLGMAVHLYGNEWQSYPPAWVIGDSASITWCGSYYSQGSVSYMDVSKSPLCRYVQGKKMLCCPDFIPPKVKYPGSGQISGYGINCQYVAGDPVVNPNDGQSGMSNWAKPARIDQIIQPAGTILFADCARFKTGMLNEEIFIYPLYKYNSTAKNYATFHFRHRGRANAVFCDGHVDSISPFQLDPASDGKCGWMANEDMDRD